MIKYFFLGINTLLLFIINFFLGDNVLVSHDIPSTLKAGEEVIVNFTIKKEINVQFAKFQLDLPQGLTASESDSKTGQFSSTTTLVKIIWMQFPADKEVNVKIKLKAETEVSGIKTISGKFQYVTGNEKMLTEIGPHDVNVINEKTVEQISNNSKSTEEVKDSKVNVIEEPKAAVRANRKISKDSYSSDYKVEIEINKDNIKGFAKYSDVIPNGLKAYGGKGSSGVKFKFVDGVATFIWATLPKTEKITATYFLSKNIDFTENPVVSGSFSYLENEQAMKVASEDCKVPILDEEIVNSNRETTNQEEIKKKEDDKLSEISSTTVSTQDTKEKVLTKEEEKQKIVSESEAKTVIADASNQKENIAKTDDAKNEIQQIVSSKTGQEETKNSVSDNNSSVSTTSETLKKTEEKILSNNVTSGTNVSAAGINFHVQIGAFKNAPGIEYFTRNYGITENIFTDMHEGLTKYMTGKFSDYKASRDHRENVKSKGVNGAFVTAYNNGKRITVQEALMLLNQKWYK